jgi:methylenetetrahydrofolate dehydrogenase (NADP+) / methenyltetrahydrofolate cyclohydrolase
MTMLLKGAPVRDVRADTLAQKIKNLTEKPTLAIIQVGKREDSTAYINAKKKFGNKIGATVLHVEFNEHETEEVVISKISELNADVSVHGIIVQIPLPPSLNKEKIIDTIAPEKDVDGLTSTSLKLLWENKKGFIPATTRGIATLLSHYGIEIQGKRVVVVGRSALVGKPTALYFTHQNSTVTVCHSKTLNLSEETKRADIIIVATGKPGLITKNHVAPHQVIVDVGINTVGGKLEEEVGERKIVGDVAFDEVKDLVRAITPVPGGVGVMTVLSLFENLLDAYDAQHAV